METPHWPRERWQDSGDEAFLLWFVFGDFDADFRIDAQRFRTRGLPPGIEAVRYRNAALAQWEGYPLAGTLGAIFEDEEPKLLDKARRAGECWMLRGNLHDPADLDGLRDLVGTIAGLCDGGGVAVVDPQMLTMFSAREWQARFFANDAFHARDHVLILRDGDDEQVGRIRVHTRGLRKFARPDLDVRNVPAALAGQAGELVLGFVEFQCAGGIITDGHEIEIEGKSQRVIAHLSGSLDDADFNNRHLALHWPD
ncbi:MAG: hypothetical protein IT467_03800 [Dokdonella sp.]|uniref:hypothetical protein n=1 Tax=Dokdonella sp. TaxID=2291710 RepID=UPI0025BE37BF|nr:hypothetical protein [Dokdonella sp.]MBZ0221477.1 hypothetical protein [Dokdonella sp.]MCC7255038.1 hypothetical protein [Dokdonella sp.]